MSDKKDQGWIRDDGGFIHTFALAFISVLILILGFISTFYFKTFAILPFSVVIIGILVFFGVLYISRAFPGTNTGGNDAAIRKGITVSIVVVYLGLLPTLAFQGIIQFQATGNKTTALLNDTIVSTVPQTYALSDTVVTSFTALVTAVILFYFESRTLENIRNPEVKNQEKSEKGTDSPIDPSIFEKIKQLKELNNDNVLTDDEFTKYKKKYLDEL